MSQVTAVASAAVGFFGKIPAEPDFVRVNAGGFLQAGLDRWFQEGVEHLRSAGLPGEPVCFVLSPAVGVQPFVGVFAPSEDALGRAFPVVIFAELDQSERAGFSLFLLRLASFFEPAARLATAAHALSTAQLAAEIDTLASGFRPAGQTPDVHAVLGRSSCSDLRAAVGGSLEAAAYALTTLVAACSQARASDSLARALVLDCPAPTDELRTFWLELVHRYSNVRMPSLLWTRESGRLLVALGPAPSLLLAYLADPAHQGARLWRLRTLDRSARTNAMARLSPAQRQVLAAENVSLAGVLHSFSQT